MVGAVALGAMALAPFLARTSASAVSELVTGGFETRFLIGPECGTPSGICAAGTTSGNLKGAFNLGVTEVIPTSETPNTSVVLFIGDANVETKGGTLRCKHSGALQTTESGALTSLCVVTPGSGTGNWANASGYFQVNGTADLGTGVASGEYRGRISRG